MQVLDLFALGMKRDVPDPIYPTGNILNLGSGNSPMTSAHNLDFPEWDAIYNPIPYEDNSVDGIYAFHFLEHFSGVIVIKILRECERVLRPGGALTVVVPHRLGSMAYHDLDHKSFWTEDSWKILFNTPYYDKNREAPWKFEIGFNMIMGIAERNLALFTQLIKVNDENVKPYL